jgi:hypothetical protein
MVTGSVSQECRSLRRWLYLGYPRDRTHYLEAAANPEVERQHEVTAGEGLRRWRSGFSALDAEPNAPWSSPWSSSRPEWLRQDPTRPMRHPT